MPDPTEPDRTVPAPADQRPSAAASDDETGATVPLGTHARVTFGPPASPGEVGVLGPYRVLKQLGAGGMGAVYLAVDTRLDRKLALKVMLPEFAADRDARERFLREAKAAAKIHHDHVVPVYEADERDGVPYITMPFLQGCALDKYVRTKGSPPLAHIIRIGREAALGLAAAHRLGLVHRDVKPANLWLEAPNGRVKILDFGLAKPIGTETELTKTGAVVGTPAYMSPEQARGLKVDARTDLFGLGAVLYRLCTGKAPFAGEHVMAVLAALVADDPAPVRSLNPDVPEPLADLIHQLLAKAPEQRPAAATDVARQLQAIAARGLNTGPAPDVSASLPVVIHPAPGQPPAVAPMSVSAQPESAFADLTDDDETDWDSTRTEPTRPRAVKRLLIAGGVLALLAVTAVAVALIPRERGRTVAEADGAKEPPATSAPPPAPPAPSVPLSSFDAFDPRDIPAQELRVAGEGDPANAPRGLVAISGSAGFHHWRNVVYTGFRDGGKTLVTASRDGTVRYWDHAAGTLTRCVRLPHLAVSVLLRGTFDLSPDGVLAACVEGDSLTVRRTDTYEPVYIRQGFWGTAQFSPDGKRLALASATSNTPAELLDTETFRSIKIDRGITDEPGKTWSRTAAFSPDGASVALWERVRDQQQIRLYEVSTGRETRTVSAKSLGQYPVWLPDGKQLVVAGQMLQIVDLGARAVRHELEHAGGARDAAVDPAGRYLASAEFCSLRVRQWDKLTEPGRTLLVPADTPNAMAFSPSGDLLAIGDTGFGVNLVRLPDVRFVDQPGARHPDHGSGGLHLTPDGRHVIRVTPGALEWCATDRPGLPVVERMPIKVAGHNWRTCVSADARRAAAVTGTGVVTVWDLVARRPLATITVPRAQAVPASGLSRTGDRLVTVLDDGSAVLHEVSSGRQLATFSAVHKDGAVAAISPDGTRVAVASPLILTAALYDDTGRTVHTLTRGDLGTWQLGWHTVAAVRFTPDGKRVVAAFARETTAEGISEGMLECWDVATGSPAFESIKSLWGVTGFDVRADGSEAVWAGSDGAVHLVELSTGKRTHRLPVGPPRGIVRHVSYTPDGRHLVTANGNGTVYVLRLRDALAPTVDASPDRMAAEWVIAQGGKVWVRGQTDGIRTTVDLPRTPFTVIGVNLQDTAVADADLSRFKGLAGLAHLHLERTRVTDAGLAHLAELSALTELHLAELQVKGPGLAHLSKLKKLTRLSLWRTPVTDAGVEHLKGMTQLTLLWLGEAPVTDAGVRHLKGLTNLSSLDLSRTPVTAEGLKYLGGLTALRGLNLSYTGLTDEDLDHLTGLRELSHLELREVKKVTAVGVKKLTDALWCRVDWTGGTVYPAAEASPTPKP